MLLLAAAVRAALKDSLVGEWTISSETDPDLYTIEFHTTGSEKTLNATIWRDEAPFSKFPIAEDSFIMQLVFSFWTSDSGSVARNGRKLCDFDLTDGSETVKVDKKEISVTKKGDAFEIVLDHGENLTMKKVADAQGTRAAADSDVWGSDPQLQLEHRMALIYILGAALALQFGMYLIKQLCGKLCGKPKRARRKSPKKKKAPEEADGLPKEGAESQPEGDKEEKVKTE